MCKYCENFLGGFEESCAETNFGENAVIRKRFGCFYLESVYDDFNLMIDYCPWCGQELDAEPGFVEEDDNPFLLALGCIYENATPSEADFIVGTYTCLESFEKDLANEYDNLHERDEMWYYLVKPQALAKYHKIAKFERCDIHG